MIGFPMRRRKGESEVDYWRRVDEWLSREPTRLGLWGMPILSFVASAWCLWFVFHGGALAWFAVLFALNAGMGAFNVRASLRRRASWEKWIAGREAWHS